MKKNNIQIRPLEESDLSTTHNWINDPEISAIMGYLPVIGLARQEKWLKDRIFSNTHYIFAICVKKTNEHIGNIGLGDIDYVHRHASLNVFIYGKNNRGKGYGSEALEQILEFGFLKLNLNKIYLKTSSKFEAAIGLYESKGFILEGKLREHYYINGIYEDKLLYSLLKNEYVQK